jgi:hypothetical protein
MTQVLPLLILEVSLHILASNFSNELFIESSIEAEGEREREEVKVGLMLALRYAAMTCPWSPEIC